MGQKNSNYEDPLDSEVVSPRRPPHKTVPPPPLPCGCDRIVKDATLAPKPKIIDVDTVHPAKLSPNHGEYIDVTGYPPIVKDTIIY